MGKKDSFDIEEVEESSELAPKCRWLKFGCGKLRVEINPVVTFFSAAIIWSAVIFCMIKPDSAKEILSPWMPWITKTWTWLYIVTQDIWFLVIVALYFSKYGDIRLGKQDEKPEYNNGSYFCMLFSAGIAIGLFYYGVAEPIYHYRPGLYGNRYYARYNDNQAAQDAMFITFFHYGIHGWIVYALIGLVMSLCTYRFGLAMSIRSCFHPLIGDRIYGVIGDGIDTLSCICTMFGVCTSLGLGTMQLNGGLHRLNNNIEESTKNQVIIIWSITAVATFSVVSGVKLGIRRISEVCFTIGMFIILTVLFYDDTWYLLNVWVQSTGYYIQYVTQIGFQTDAFAQLGNAPDKLENPDWIGSWTIFYWGWWIAWAPFVGMFIAKISRGRTIKEFIMYSMTLPIIYAFFWFSIFGGVAIKTEREAFWANITCLSEFGGKYSTEPGINGLYRLSCRNTTDMWFDVVSRYEGIGYFMSCVSIVAIILYFVTSSDSGSLVIDSLSANGHPDPPVLQRIFWAVTEGAAATGLLVAGGKEALNALQTTSIAAGLVYTIILNFMCISLWRLVKIDAGELDPNGPQFHIDMLDVLYKLKPFLKFCAALFIPWYFLGRANGKISNCKPYLSMVVLAIMYYTFIILEIAEVFHHGLAYIGWTLYVGFASYATVIRTKVREEHEINGNLVEDFFALLLVFPAVAVQVDEHMIHYESMKKNDVPLEYVTPSRKQNSDFSDLKQNIDLHGVNNEAYTFPPKSKSDNSIDMHGTETDAHIIKRENRLSTHI